MFVAVNPAASKTKLKLIEFNDQHEILFSVVLSLSLSPLNAREFSPSAAEVYLWENYWRGEEIIIEISNKNYVSVAHVL